MAAMNGMPCSLRISSFMGRSCASDETVVGCHLPIDGKGIATKVSDLGIAAGCFHCHAILDGKDHHYLIQKYPAAYLERLWKAQNETQARLVEMELITGPDWQIT